MSLLKKKRTKRVDDLLDDKEAKKMKRKTHRRKRKRHHSKETGKLKRVTYAGPVDQPLTSPRPSFPAYLTGQRGIRGSHKSIHDEIPPSIDQPPPSRPTEHREPVRLASKELGQPKRMIHDGEVDDITKRDTTLKCIEGLMGFMEYNVRSTDAVRDPTRTPLTGQDDAPTPHLQETAQPEKSGKLVDFARSCLESDILDASRAFAKIPSPGPPLTHESSDCNPDGCRFEDVHCIDQSRVILQSSGPATTRTTDFVHANRLVLDEKREVIVTQLPIATTAAHFWMMIVQENVESVLLILTRHEWDLFVKDQGILPENGCLHMNNEIRVIQQQENALTSQITLSILTVFANGRNRPVHLYHYHDWYHDVAPNNSDDIWKLHSALRKYNGPTVILSLSGCGRAGTFAAFELLNSQLRNDGVPELSIVGAVESVRKSRFAAVQNPQQLAFIAMAFMDRFLSSQRLKSNVPKDVQSTYADLKSSMYEKISAKNLPLAHV